MRHLARHEIERLVAKSDGSGQVIGSEHLQNCPRCAERKRAIQEERSRYLQQHPSDAFIAAVLGAAKKEDKKRSFPEGLTRGWFAQRYFWASLAVGATALALLFWFKAPGFVSPMAVSSNAARYKGSDALEVYARHKGRDIKFEDGVALSPGDQLAFVTVVSRPRYLLLLGIDDAGTITRYFPENNASSARPLTAGRRQLPLGIELDSRRGQERLFAVFSSSPVDEAKTRAALARTLGELSARGLGVVDLTELDLPGSWVTVWFRKP